MAEPKESVPLPTRLWWTGYLAYHLFGQDRYPYKPLAAIRRDQSRRVRAMVAYAYQYVPYYRETMTRLGLRPDDFQTAADLAKLPLLERRQLQQDPEYFVSTTKPLGKCFNYRTGGSTGEPVEVYHDTASMFRTTAHGHRESPVVAKFLGRPWGYRHAVIVIFPGMIQGLISFTEKRRYFPPRLRIQRQYLHINDPVEQILRQLNEFKPDVVHSLGSYFAFLVSQLEASGAPFHRPRLITYVADRLPEATRRVFNDKYHIPVVSYYGSLEALKIGFECEAHLGYHLNLDLYPVRLIDGEGREVPEGETGEVVVSNLVNRATVILNYPLGDLAAFLPQVCPCGRTLPLLSFPEGRTLDLIRLPSGEKVYPLQATIMLNLEKDLWQYQMVQKAPDHLELRLVPTEKCNREETANRLVKAITQLYGQDIRVEVVFGADVQRTATGKVRQVLSLLPESVTAGPGG